MRIKTGGYRWILVGLAAILMLAMVVYLRQSSQEGFSSSGFYQTCSSSTSVVDECIVYILSWKRVSKNARDIFDAIKSVHDKTYILNCDETFAMDRGSSVIQADDSYYFTKQMYTVFRHCAKNHPGSYIMTITGDVSPKANWSDVIQRCLRGFSKFHAGIVAPNVDYTYYDAWAKKANLGDNYWTVQNTDCTVWAIHPCIYRFLLETDVDAISKFGWGIDWLLIQVCEKYNLPVVRDYNNTIRHPRDRGYTNEKAVKEFKEIQTNWNASYSQLA